LIAIIRSHDSGERRSGLERLDAGGGDQHGDRPKLGTNLLESGSHSRAVRDIDLNGDRFCSRCAQVGRSLLGRLARAVEQRDPVAVGRESLGDAQSDARRSSGHNGNSTWHVFSSAPAVQVLSRLSP
jgi:hypothetical protein